MLPRTNYIQCKDADFLVFSGKDYISTELFKNGEWEPHLLTISKYFLSEIDKPLLLDIGTNLGAYSIPLAKYVNQFGGHVIGFEAQRIIYYQLCANIFINRLDNYDAFHFAVSNTLGEIEMPEIDYENHNNIGGVSLEKKWNVGFGVEQFNKHETKKVKTITLDSFNIEKSPSLIKIDVEGYEQKVFEGGLNFLAKHKFPPIIFETWNTDWYKEERDKVFITLKNIGYLITSIGNDNIAQHPENLVYLEFKLNEDGNVSLIRHNKTNNTSGYSDRST